MTQIRSLSLSISISSPTLLLGRLAILQVDRPVLSYGCGSDTAEFPQRGSDTVEDSQAWTGPDEAHQAGPPVSASTSRMSTVEGNKAHGTEKKLRATEGSRCEQGTRVLRVLTRAEDVSKWMRKYGRAHRPDPLSAAARKLGGPRCSRHLAESRRAGRILDVSFSGLRRIAPYPPTLVVLLLGTPRRDLCRFPHRIGRERERERQRDPSIS